MNSNHDLKNRAAWLRTSAPPRGRGELGGRRDQSSNHNQQEPAEPPAGGRWSRIITLAGLVVLGLTPWAQAQQPLPDYPAICPPLTAFATPTLFDVFFGTQPFRFPYG